MSTERFTPSRIGTATSFSASMPVKVGARSDTTGLRRIARRLVDVSWRPLHFPLSYSFRTCCCSFGRDGSALCGRRSVRELARNAQPLDDETIADERPDH